MSIFTPDKDPHDPNAPNQTNTTATAPSLGLRATQLPPQFIAMPPIPQMFAGSTLSPSLLDDPIYSPLESPALEMYHTAPSTPIMSPLLEVPSAASHQRTAESPAAKLHITIPSSVPASEFPVEDAFPTGEIPIDLVEDEGLSALEKIYLYARSQSVYHRLFIVHALPAFLEQVTPQEALAYVLPLLPGLAIDDDEKVKEALVVELGAVIWWFFTHCQVIPDDPDVEEHVYSSSTASNISVQAFTPILGTLLLSPNHKVGGGARSVVVNILARMRKLDRRESGALISTPSPLVSSSGSDSEEDDEPIDDIPIGLFGREERLMFEQELLQQVVIGMGKLDIDAGDDVEEASRDEWVIQTDETDVEVAGQEETPPSERPLVSPRELKKPPDTSPSEGVTSYFPSMPPYSAPSPGSSNSSTPNSSTPSSLTDTSSTSASPPVSLTSPPRHVLNPSPSHTDPSSPSALNPAEARPPPSPTTSQGRPASDAGTEDHGTDDGEGDQAAVGRLSSMSLMAAVTANGCLDDNTKQAFVREVERVAHDPVYWVRREASYALGALAKVVPEEVVVISLLPLFTTLRGDSQWHVRHSAMFALPAILSRLPPNQRRKLALDSILPLSTDESQPVRSGALEALGEVLYTFHEDPNGPPEELVQLFLGRKEDKRVRDGQQAAQDREQILNSLFRRPTAPRESPMTSFYVDPARPLICAFNYPAVALTLGRERWGDLREAYLEIAQNREVSVRRSLAASLGELAKIIGEEHADRDLLGVWWDAVRSEEEEVRERALECVETFAGALGTEPRKNVVSGLLELWEQGMLRGWRERKGVAKALSGLAPLVRRDIPHVLRGLLRKALEDGVAAVREAAISALPRIWSMFAEQDGTLADLRRDIRELSQSGVHRQRMTFVGCLQALLTSPADGSPSIGSEDELWSVVSSLADDAVVGVRIAVARLVQLAAEQSKGRDRPVAGFLKDLARHLSLDASHDVRAYVRDTLNATPTRTSDVSLAEGAPKRPKFTTFSRPPPASVFQHSEGGLTRTAQVDSNETVVSSPNRSAQ